MTLSRRVRHRRRPWREEHWCALDFELTGLDPKRDEIISFGAIPIDGGRLVLGASVTGLIRPQRELKEDAIRIHGIRAADLAVAPPLTQAIGPLLDALAHRVVVAHTAAVERIFLGRALAALGIRRRIVIVDTEVLGRLWLYERDGRLRPRIALGELARELGLPAERPHDALGDALTTGQVFIALATHLDAMNRETVGSLVDAGHRIEAVRIWNAG